MIVCFVDIGGIVDHHCLKLSLLNYRKSIAIVAGGKGMVFNTTFNNISVISWRSV